MIHFDKLFAFLALIDKSIIFMGVYIYDSMQKMLHGTATFRLLLLTFLFQSKSCLTPTWLVMIKVVFNYFKINDFLCIIFDIKTCARKTKSINSIENRYYFKKFFNILYFFRLQTSHQMFNF